MLELALTCCACGSIGGNVGVTDAISGVLGLFADSLEDDVANNKNSDNEEGDDQDGLNDVARLI